MNRWGWANLGALATTVGMALYPSAAPAVSFSFGEPGSVALFRGAGGLFGSSNSRTGPSGIDTLAERIDRELGDYALTLGVFDPYEGSVLNFEEVGSRQATSFLNQFEDGRSLGLVGYSAGGLSAIRTAKNVSPKPIDLLVQVDSFEPLTGASREDEVLPGNVDTGLNYYQRRNRFNAFRPDWEPTDLQGATNVVGSQNINAEESLGDRAITHRNMMDNVGLQNRIVQDIQNNVLDGLTFDREKRLTLGRGASTPKNVLRLTPGGERRDSVATLAAPISSDRSFQSRLVFRMPFDTLSEGLSYWVGPSAEPGEGALTLKFDPMLAGDGDDSNKLLLLTPGQGGDSKKSPVELNGRDPVRAWVDYDSDRQRYEVFVNNSLSKPEQPIFSRTIDLSAWGPETYFGFRAAGANDGQYAELLSWQLETTASRSLLEADQSARALLNASDSDITNWIVLDRASTDKEVLEPGIVWALILLGGGLGLSRWRRRA